MDRDDRKQGEKRSIGSGIQPHEIRLARPHGGWPPACIQMPSAAQAPVC
jgi:hypothetical protein